MKLAVIDLDGTLFDERHRNHLAKEGNWDNYHQAHKHDKVFEEMLDFVQKLHVTHEIIFLTGRTENHRESSVKQLANLKIHSHDFIMRQVDDLRPSAEYKSKAMQSIIDEMAEEYVLESIVIVDDLEKNLIAMLQVCAAHKINWSAYLAKDGLASFFGGVEYDATVKIPERVNVFAPKAPTAEILRSMADTFEERNKVYGSNYERVAPIMKILFPDGLTPEILHSDQWHLFELIVVKLTRFAISGLQHKDSIHDTGVYAAMIESILEKQNG